MAMMKHTGTYTLENILVDLIERDIEYCEGSGDSDDRKQVARMYRLLAAIKEGNITGREADELADLVNRNFHTDVADKYEYIAE
jgi:hypothetical protein